MDFYGFDKLCNGFHVFPMDFVWISHGVTWINMDLHGLYMYYHWYYYRMGANRY